MAMRWTVALVQIDVALGQPEANRTKARRLVEGLPPAVDVAVLPELWTTGYALESIPALAEPDDGPTATLMARLAREGRVNLVAGSLATAAAGRFFNQAYAFDRAGHTVATYRKVHLFRPMGEDGTFAPGDRFAPFTFDGVACGLLICYDLRFPEAARSLALAGVRVLFVPAQWPLSRLEHWRALLVARAIENQCFAIGVNAVGERRGEVFAGHSMVVDPWGRVVAEADGEEGITLATIDLAEVDRVRAAFSALSDRVPAAYVKEGGYAGAAQV